MLKIISLSTIFFIVSFIGVEISSNYSKKERLFRELLSFCNLMINNIKFNKNKLYIILKENINNYSSELRSYLECYINGTKYKSSLISEEQDIKISEFISGLGCFDVNGEVGYIENYKSIFYDYHMTAKENNKKYGSLFSKLGIVSGILLVILLI